MDVWEFILTPRPTAAIVWGRIELQVRQNDLIRGASVTNPPLILLHGGRSFSETHFFRHFNAEFETRFTVVYWDRRGAGKSLDRRFPCRQ